MYKEKVCQQKTLTSMVEKTAWESDKIDTVSLLVLLCIKKYANNNTGVAWITVGRIAKECKCTTRTVFNKLSMLKKEGFLCVENRFKNNEQISNLYRIKLPETKNEDVEDIDLLYEAQHENQGSAFHGRIESCSTGAGKLFKVRDETDSHRTLNLNSKIELKNNNLKRYEFNSYDEYDSSMVAQNYHPSSTELHRNLNTNLKNERRSNWEKSHLSGGRKPICQEVEIPSDSISVKKNSKIYVKGDSDFLDSSHPKNKTQEACKDQKDDSGKEDSFKTSPVIPQELSSVNDSHTSSHTPPIPKDSLPNLKHSPKALNQFTEPQGTAPKQSLEKPLPQFRPTPSPDILFLQKVKAEYVKKSITNDGELFHLLSMAKKKVSEDEIIAIVQRHKESVNKTDAQENGYRFIPSIQKFFLEDGEWNNWIDKRPATQKPFKDWTPEEIEHFRANVLFKKPKKLTYED